jgi:hypothetical protein
MGFVMMSVADFVMSVATPRKADVVAVTGSHLRFSMK